MEALKLASRTISQVHIFIDYLKTHIVLLNYGEAHEKRLAKETQTSTAKKIQAINLGGNTFKPHFQNFNAVEDKDNQGQQ